MGIGEQFEFEKTGRIEREPTIQKQISEHYINNILPLIYEDWPTDELPPLNSHLSKSKLIDVKDPINQNIVEEQNV